MPYHATAPNTVFLFKDFYYDCNYTMPRFVFHTRSPDPSPYASLVLVAPWLMTPKPGQALGITTHVQTHCPAIVKICAWETCANRGQGCEVELFHQFTEKNRISHEIRLASCVMAPWLLLGTPFPFIEAFVSSAACPVPDKSSYGSMGGNAMVMLYRLYRFRYSLNSTSLLLLAAILETEIKFDVFHMDQLKKCNVICHSAGCDMI